MSENILASVMQGIDVSHHNGTIDWKAVKAAGKQFVMIRAGYGNNNIDKCFKANIAGALKADLHVGAYWFSYAYNTGLAQEEAKSLATLMAPYKGKVDFPMSFDWEDDSKRYAESKGVKVTPELVVDMACAFLKQIEKEGWYAINYQNLNYTKLYFSSPRMKAFDVWLARYQIVPGVDCGLHQTSDTGKIPGMSCDFDLNVSYKDYPKIVREHHLNGY